MVSKQELEKELKRIDKHYGRKLDRLCEQSLGRSKEARQIKKEWMEKVIKIEKEIKTEPVEVQKRIKWEKKKI